MPGLRVSDRRITRVHRMRGGAGGAWCARAQAGDPPLDNCCRTRGLAAAAKLSLFNRDRWSRLSISAVNMMLKPMLESESIIDVLRTIDDPEMPINIVDLGLVEDVRIEGVLV